MSELGTLNFVLFKATQVFSTTIEIRSLGKEIAVLARASKTGSIWHTEIRIFSFVGEIANICILHLQRSVKAVITFL